ncbi:MAG: DNA gyrase subunit A, partial [Candidatus Hydrogenedentes bacterium]|nr:DNA gyrase subunit A [Candidatus Hydrogenedentota bacterium]
CMLVDGQGNFGSMDGDPPAAMRYTEARLARVGELMLADIERQTVDMEATYDGSMQEPAVLPSAFPNLLVNGSSGIAVAMATNIPPHNLGEVVDALVALIDDPSMDVLGLMEHIKGPDFPTGGVVLGRAGFQSAYHTGRGKIIVRARASVERAQRSGKDRIVVTEIPFQVNKSRLLESIADLVRQKRIEGVADLRDESDRDGMRIVVELKRGELAQVVLNQLYKHTSMQETFGAIMLALVNNRPVVMGLKDMLLRYLDHRREIVRRRTLFELTRAEDRAHVLEGLMVAVDRIDEVVTLIRKSKNVEEARTGLVRKFGLTEAQARAILDMRLHRLTGLERDKLLEDHKELVARIKLLKRILSSEKNILAEVEKELLEIKEKHANARRTEILTEAGEFELEDLIADEDMAVSISHTGYIKRIPVSTYRKQRRGGKGVTGMGTKEEDFVEHLLIASTHQYLLFFTDRGRVHWLKVHQVPRAGRVAKGRAIVNLLHVDKDESLTAFLSVREFKEGKYVFMATERGVVKRTALTAFRHPRRGGIMAILLDEGDRLIETLMTDGESPVILATEQGQAIRFAESDVRAIGRATRGVRGISLAKGDRVVDMAVPRDDETVLGVTENGYGKRTRVSEYRLQKRGGRGIINIKTSKRNGRVVAVKPVRDIHELVIMTARGMVIRSPVKEISVIGRNTQGVRLISLHKGDKVVGVAIVTPEEEKPAPQEPESTGDKQEKGD